MIFLRVRGVYTSIGMSLLDKRFVVEAVCIRRSSIMLLQLNSGLIPILIMLVLGAYMSPQEKLTPWLCLLLLFLTARLHSIPMLLLS